MKENHEKLVSDMIERIVDLNKNTPDGTVIDSDTILLDLVESCDMEIVDLSQDIFDIWKNSTDKEAVEKLFYTFTDVEFIEYLERCLAETTRK